jgi:MFS family permease
MGPLLLGRLFDTVGRIPMIAGTYLLSAALTALLGVLLLTDSLTTTSFMVLIAVTFFIASAGASSAYLTVSEVFPMETRALAIALFFAIGTAIGGITGPLVFGQFIHSGDVDLVATGFFIGAGAMALGGVAELAVGVRAEQQSLESIARPLTAEEADGLLEEPSGTEVELAAARERDERVRQRTARRGRDNRGLRRLGPGPGSRYYSPGMVGSVGAASRTAATADQQLDREIELLVRTLQELGGLDRDELARLVGGPGWGPRRFRAALREALREGRAERLTRRNYGPRRPASGPPPIDG